MFTALYYPHVKLSKDLLKNALFLWDRVEYIAPDQLFIANYDEPELAHIQEFFLKSYVPTQEDKEQVNDVITDLLKHSLPDWLFVKNANLRYSFYPEKLFPETWERLKKEGLVETVGERLVTSPEFGLTVMSILADCCAGSEKRLITDEITAYSAFDRYLVSVGRGDLGEFDMQSERLITISLKIMNFKNVELSRLVELRQKEQTHRGAHLRLLRHNYLKKIEEYINRFSQVQNKEDIIELERLFEQEMQDDLNLLSDELKDEAQKIIFSPEMLAGIVAGASSLLSPPNALIALGAGGALYKKTVEYRASRNKTLRGHSMSWLYSMRRLQVV